MELSSAAELTALAFALWQSQLQEDLARLRRDQSTVEVERVNILMQAEQQAQQRERGKIDALKAELVDAREQLRNRVSPLESELARTTRHAHYLEEQLSEMAARMERERRAHALAQEHLSSQLMQSRSRVLACSDRLLRLDAYGVPESNVAPTILEIANEIAEDLRRECEAHRCVVCLEQQSETVLQPCSHNVLCSKCTEHVKHTSGCCPLCRSTIQSSFRIFK